MRISLLLEREPFGTILEQTLSKFWTLFYGQAYSVRWQAGCPGFHGHRAIPSGQQWLVNAYLNAIFVRNVEPAVFEPVRREFSRSTIWWKRPLQQTYVTAGLSRFTAPWLAQASLHVAPGVEDARHKLIVAGNHKIRILDERKGLSYGLLKHGFDDRFMQRELRYRQMADSLGIPSPPLIEISPQGDWFVEQFVNGTPVNRLDGVEIARRAVATASKALRRLIEHTVQSEQLDVYLSSLTSRIGSLIASNHLLSGTQKHALQKNVERLQRGILQQTTSESRSIPVAITHGDFQPANILVNSDQVWLIDWEYADRRQAAYDLLVYGLKARFPHGLASRLKAFVDGRYSLQIPGVEGWPGFPDRSQAERRRIASLFLMEELALHLEENAQPLLARVGEGLRLLQVEIARWLEQLS